MITAFDWRPSPDVTLEKNAKFAVRTLDRHVAVVAGPGSGKTELLAQRANFLLMTGSVPFPRRILALCFKREAVTTLHDRVRQRCGTELATRFDCMTFHAFSKSLIDRFRLRLPENCRPAADFSIVDKNPTFPDSLMFDMMLKLACRIVESSPELLRASRASWPFAMLDEFQDCTDDQYALIRLLFDGGGTWVTAVGDRKQSIMGFLPGSLENSFELYIRDFEAIKLPLFYNHRSVLGLRQLQWHFVRSLEPSSAGDFPSGENQIGAVVSWIECANIAAESKEVCRAIETWHAEGVPLHEIAVLNSKQTGSFSVGLKSEMDSRGLPYRDESTSRSELAEPLGRLIVAWLLLLSKDSSPDSWAGVSDAMIRAHGGPSDNDFALIRQLGIFLKDERMTVSGRGAQHYWASVLRLLTETLTRQGIQQAWPRYGRGDLDEKVVNGVRDTFFRVSSRVQDTAMAIEYLDGKGAVRIMNIHKCKGMEFEKVVMMGVEPGEFFGGDSTERFKLFVALSRAKSGVLVTRCHNRPGQRGGKPGAKQNIDWFFGILANSGLSPTHAPILNGP